MVKLDEKARLALDRIIRKARVHFYKPIQIAEVLYKERMGENSINLAELETYRTISRKWRDEICEQFLGRVSTSSVKYQDDLFTNDNAIPPAILVELGKINKKYNGIVEGYIYQKFSERFSQMHSALSYCDEHSCENFKLNEFLDLFWLEAGLRRSVDKIYEIVVYSLFSVLVEKLEVSVEISLNPQKRQMLLEFEDFASQVINLSGQCSSLKLPAKIHRVGVTNAADRGLDMWANFGMAIQIKHLSLTEELAENIVGSVSADRIVIVCKDSEQKIIVSLLNQIGWKSKIQSIITENNLIQWYEKALRGAFSHELGKDVLDRIKAEIWVEFPATDQVEFMSFYRGRGYDKLDYSFL